MKIDNVIVHVVLVFEEKIAFNGKLFDEIKITAEPVNCTNSCYIIVTQYIDKHQSYNNITIKSYKYDSITEAILAYHHIINDITKHYELE